MGKKFPRRRTQGRIICASCEDALPEIEKESVDLMCTNPPYGASFMSKSWDKALPPVGVWKECLRVLKPGAFAFVMSLPRADLLWRMISRLEEAGFIVSFTPIFWAYACLSEDTEVLTDRGWKNYKNILATDVILCYNSETGGYFFERPEKWHTYFISDTCIRIKSDSTDQLVTKNHRVLVEREGKLSCLLAERLSTKEAIPVVESLSDLQKVNFQEIPSWEILCGLLKRMPKQTNRDNQFREAPAICKKRQDGLLSALWKRILCVPTYITRGCWKILLAQLQSQNSQRQTPQRIQQEAQNRRTQLDFGAQDSAQFENERSRKSILEGRGNLQERIRQSLECEVCTVSTGIQVNGERRRICNGAQTTRRTNDSPFSTQKRSCASQRPQSKKQCDKQSDALRQQSRPQIIRGRKPHQTTLASVVKEHYTGIVFCPTVSTGYFIARRKDKIFITGNSGFPKAQNIGKAVDKRAGVERKVLGSKKSSFGRQKGGGPGWAEGITGEKIKRHDFDITEPSTPGAIRLDGSYGGFQPKPALEVIICAMKPLSEKTFVDQALKNRHGITWLGDGRIPFVTEDEKYAMPHQESRTGERISSHKWGMKQTNIQGSPQGRFPANLLVSDDVLNDGRERHKAGNKKPMPHRDPKTIPEGFGKHMRIHAHNGEHNPDYYGDSGPFSRYFDLDAWYKERIQPSGKTFPFLIVPKAANKEKWFYCRKCKKVVHAPRREEHEKHAHFCKDCRIHFSSRSGKHAACETRSNFVYHPTVKPFKLMCYLLSIGSREGDLVLDPYAGTCKTAMAAKILKRRYVMIERDKVFVKMGKHAVEKIRLGK